jgi:hypothetical protein
LFWSFLLSLEFVHHRKLSALHHFAFLSGNRRSGGIALCVVFKSSTGLWEICAAISRLETLQRFFCFSKYNCALSEHHWDIELLELDEKIFRVSADFGND